MLPAMARSLFRSHAADGSLAFAHALAQHLAALSVRVHRYII